MNVTLSLEKEILRDARILAARRGASLTGMLREEIRHLVEADRGYERARRSALRRLARGTSLGGGPLPSREERHARG